MRSGHFDKCEQLDKPKWLRFLPSNANDKWRDDFTDPKTAQQRERGETCSSGQQKVSMLHCSNVAVRCLTSPFKRSQAKVWA